MMNTYSNSWRAMVGAMSVALAGCGTAPVTDAGEQRDVVTDRRVDAVVSPIDVQVTDTPVTIDTPPSPDAGPGSDIAVIDVPPMLDVPAMTDGDAASVPVDVRDVTDVVSDASSPLALPVSVHIVVDQFGYLPASEKIAVVRSPIRGFDSADTFTPGSAYSVVNTATGARVFSAAPVVWSAGATDAVSGDRAWWFDFSSVTAPGSYVIVDTTRGVRSVAFTVGTTVYRQVLRHAVRTFFYQRAGQAKTAALAGATWADGASHLGAGQDTQARRWADRSNPATARDLRGGWYDAGDYNKYTSWAANYVIGLLRAYNENRTIWTDDYGIPESGNGIPDIVDEIRWGLDFLVRMQSADGSVLTIVGVSHASPPSAATGPSYYGDASTNATLRTAAAFAFASSVLRTVGDPALTTYATSLLPRARSAWTWAVANPNVVTPNNTASNGTTGLGAGNQETDTYGRLVAKLQAAVSLFAATSDPQYRTYFDANYMQAHLMQWSYAGPFENEGQDALLDYTLATGATASIVTAIRTTYRNALNSDANLGSLTRNADPYLATLAASDYTWGSNATKSQQGNLLYDLVSFALDASANANAQRAASRYVHYLHGVNPLHLVYLTNMGAAGAENSAQQMYHAWFDDGTRWDTSPAPGYLTGGPNPSYDWDGCCPAGCGSAANNALCTSESISPPRGQPPAKSYKDFNTNWPLNSWSVSEPSNGYQVAYIRLLSKFVQ